MVTESAERVVRTNIVVPAAREAVWQAWSTPEGARTFFAPECNVDLRPGGPYEMFFNPGEEPGKRGGEGMIVLAFQPERMLSFTWNAPPHLATVRPHMTHATVYLRAVAEEETYVALLHDGWGEGGEWDSAFDYFKHAWSNVILPRLKYRFVQGPVDWNARPSLEELAEMRLD